MNTERIYNLNSSFGYILRDKASVKKKEYILELYGHDMFAVFINKLTVFMVNSEAKKADAQRLREMLDEIIKVKGILSS